MKRREFLKRAIVAAGAVACGGAAVAAAQPELPLYSIVWWGHSTIKVTPIVFDDAIILTSVLHSEPYPLVTTRKV